jgi:dipeptidyl aminopeptidase/acylaminoacyl peptidase
MAGPSVKQLSRALPVTRLIDGGMNYADAVGLHAALRDGADWLDHAERLARQNLGRARAALAGGHASAAREWFLRASACWRYGQSPLRDDDPRKRAAYRELLDSFARAGALHSPPFERFELPWRDGTISGWLAWPDGAAPAPLVVILGGVDAWREDYENSARRLRARGIGTLLLDLPGQGETRLFGGLPFRDGAFDATTPLIDALLDLPRCDGRVGVWGNSAGGWMALHMAAREPRIAACCVNGGTDRPTEILDRFPRFIDRIRQWTGCADGDAACAMLDRLALGGQTLSAVRCPLLMTHGVPDRVFLIDGARRIHSLVAGEDKLLIEFADGDHGLSSHARERDTRAADWFFRRLAVRARVTAVVPSS